MKTILITGATAGFGEATAKLLGEKGNRLILVARREEKLNSLKEEIGGEIFTYKLDIQNKQAVKDFVMAIPKEFKDIDVLINNAGLALGRTPAYESNLDDWDTMINTNVKGLVYLTHEILPTMKLRNSGLIVNLGSVAGHAPYMGGNVYGATKAFVKQFSRNLRADLLGTQIKVTNIEPGMAETEFSLVRFEGDEVKAKEVYKDMKPLSADDIASTIDWVIERPTHVNIDNIEIMPLDQSWGGLAVNRKS